MKKLKLSDLLPVGRDNALSGQELCRVLNLTIRELQNLVRRERRDGAPICAATGRNPGYYIAETPQEMQSYCRSLRKRAGEIFATRRDCLKAMGLEKECSHVKH